MSDQKHTIDIGYSRGGKPLFPEEIVYLLTDVNLELGKLKGMIDALKFRIECLEKRMGGC